MPDIKRASKCNILSQWCISISQGVGSKQIENTPLMNAQKLKTAIALAALLQVPGVMADVSISGQVTVTTSSSDPSTTTGLFEYMSNVTFATFDSFAGASSNNSSDWITDENNLGSLYGSIRSGEVWKNTAGEVLTTEYTTNDLYDGSTTTTLSLVNGDGQHYGYSYGTDPVVLHTTGISGLMDIQDYPTSTFLYESAENIEYFEGINGNTAGTKSHSQTSDLTTLPSADNLSLEAYFEKSTGETLLLGSIPSDNNTCSSGTSEYDCSTYGIFSQTMGLSKDGSTVVGVAGMLDRGALSIGDLPAASYLQAFQWKEESGMVGLGSLPGGNISSFANAVNDDGTTIVGFASGNNGREAFVWTESQGIVGLGDLQGGDFYSVATNLNQDGTVVVGFSKSSSGTLYEAFRWTDSVGMLSIREWLIESGVPVPSNAKFELATNISNDGSVVIGTNRDGAWLAYGGRGTIKLNEIVTTTAASTASIPQTASSISTMALHGAHHQPLLAQKRLSSDRCAWINGDFANYHDKKADSHLVEAGICKDPTDNIRAGIGIGKSKTQQTLDYSGSSDIVGRYILGEFNYLHNNSTLLSTTMLHGRWDADINRGYLNAGTEDQSMGSTDIKATALRLRIDWLDLHTVGNTTITPKVEYTLTKSDVDGYTETTGGFPTRFDLQSHTARESRVGLVAENDLDTHTTVRGMVEAVHRFDKSGAAFSGEVIDMFPFSIPGRENRQNWIRIGGEIDRQIDKDSFVSFSLMRSSKGEDADMSGAIGWKGNF